MTSPQKNTITRAPIMVSTVALSFMSVCLFMFLLKLARDIMVPFMVAVFIWYLINAVARGLEKLDFAGIKIPAFWRFAFSIGLFFSGMVFVGKLISSNVRDVMREASKYQENLKPVMDQALSLLHIKHQPTVTELMQYIDIDEWIGMLAGGFTGIGGKMLLVMLFTGFLLYEQKYFDWKITRFFATRTDEKRLRDILHRIDAKIRRYIASKALVSVIDSILTYTILSYLDVDFAGFWGIMAFFLHFIPYAGSFIALTLPSMIALIQFGEIENALLVLGALSLSHAFIGHFLDPWIMGNSLNLSPIIIVSSLAMWGMIWGIPGMFLAVPILASTAIVLAQFERTKPLAVLISKTGLRKRKE